MVRIPLPSTRSFRTAAAPISASVLIALVLDLQSLVPESKEPSVDSKGELPRRLEPVDLMNLMQGARIHVESVEMHDNAEAHILLAETAGASHAKGIQASDPLPMQSKTAAKPFAMSFATASRQDAVASENVSAASRFRSIRVGFAQAVGSTAAIVIALVMFLFFAACVCFGAMRIAFPGGLPDRNSPNTKDFAEVLQQKELMLAQAKDLASSPSPVQYQAASGEAAGEPLPNHGTDPDGININVERPPRAEMFGVIAAAWCAVGLALWLSKIMFEQLNDTGGNSWTKLWILFALVAPLTFVYQYIFTRVLLLYEQLHWLRVELDSTKSKILFTAVANEIEKAAEKQADTSSADVEARSEYDRNGGRMSVKLRFWGKRSKTVHLRLPDDNNQLRELRVDFNRGDDVVCGRDHSIHNTEVLVLRLAATRNRLQDKGFLTRWLEGCLKIHQRPSEDVVEVFALDQSSVDWVPEWKIRCVRPMKRAGGAGQGFFLQRESTCPLLADACTWFGKELRCYLITGPPGTGKTETTIWLAGYLRVPLYRLSLNDPRLSDQLFAQLVSPTGLQHDNAVLQIDEFQETLQRWGSGTSSKGVSMGGFCEVLQGSNSLPRGFIVLSGTQQVARTMTDPTYAAVFRRIAVTTFLSGLTALDVQIFFSHFVADFVTGCPLDDVQRWAVKFTGEEGPWGSGGVSIDMVKQFLMNRISGFRAEFLPDQNPDPDIPCRVPPEHRQHFAKYLCEHDAARLFLTGYPPVNEEP